jgi:PEP-CTERM motif-containing protein
MRSANRGVVLVAILFACMTQFSYADSVGDPAVLHIGATVACAQNGCFLFNGNEVNGINSTSLFILENGMGQPNLLNPLVLLLGIPNGNGTPPAISSVSNGDSGQLGGSGGGAYGGTWNNATGLISANGGVFDASAGSSTDVYSFSGFVPGGNNSELFGNWQAADSAVLGINAASFTIYAYTITGSPSITGGESLLVNFSSAIPLGTFAVAYGCSQLASPGPDCSNKQNPFTTAFTNSGLETSGPGSRVPEPGSIALLGSGLVVLGGVLRRRFARS